MSAEFESEVRNAHAVAARAGHSPACYPPFPEMLPAMFAKSGRYTLGIARSADELDAVLKLRFAVFNLELGEGLNRSYVTLRDEDEFDHSCHHLLVRDADGTVIGTYRMQTFEMAEAGAGFYSAGEFDLSALPEDVLRQSAELGRACIAHEHRNSRVLFLLWRGLALYLQHLGKNYMFGCCSLTSQDPLEAQQVLNYLEEQGDRHESIHVRANDSYTCRVDASTPITAPARVRIPRLMRLYIEYGAKIVSEPAIDRAFKTIDFLALNDLGSLSPRARQMFLS